MRRRTESEKQQFRMTARRQGKMLQMTAGAFRIADDFPAIAKQQRIIQAHDENPLFVVEPADNMTPAELGKMLAPNGVPPIKLNGSLDGKEQGYWYTASDGEDAFAYAKQPLAQAIKEFHPVTVKLNRNGPTKAFWPPTSPEPGPLEPFGVIFVGMDMAKVGDTPLPDPPPPGAMIHVMNDELREQMLRDRYEYELLLNRIEPDASYQDRLRGRPLTDDERRLRALTVKIRDAIDSTFRNSPKCLGVDVLLDRRSYYSLVVDDLRSQSRVHEAGSGPLFFGARIMMYDCDTELLEARPRWR